MPRAISGRGVIRVGVLVAFLLAITAAVALLAIAPGSASAFSKAIWGPAYVNGVNQFPIYKRLHVSIVENSLNWAEVAPTRPRHASDPRDPAYKWPAGIEQEIQQAQRYHMRVLIEIEDVPGWANGHHPENWMPNNPKDFAAFTAAASRKYPQVRLWMIWGEPSRGLQPLYSAPLGAKTLSRKQQIAPRNYARLLDASYGALKAVSHKNLVIGGDTYSGGLISAWMWIKYMKLPSGHAPRMDMYGHNPFSTEDPNFSSPQAAAGYSEFSDLKRLAAWMDRYLKPGLPLFLPEFTIPTAPDKEFDFYVNMPVAVKWIRDALRLSRSWKRIYALGWIHVYDDPPVSSGGLLTVAGKPKATFYAFSH